MLSTKVYELAPHLFADFVDRFGGLLRKVLVGILSELALAQLDRRHPRAPHRQVEALTGSL